MKQAIRQAEANARAMRPFTQSLPMALLAAREVAMRRFRPLLADNSLTEQQWRVLRALTAASEALSIGELARHTMLLSPSLTRILVSLEHRGLTSRETNPSDQRQRYIGLTDEGRALVREVAPLSEDQYQLIESTFGEERLQHLLDELHALSILLSVETVEP